MLRLQSTVLILITCVLTACSQQDILTPAGADTPAALSTRSPAASPTSTIAVPSSPVTVPTITATTLPTAVQMMPIDIMPETLILSAGEMACFWARGLTGWNSDTLPGTLPRWSFTGLPGEATAEFQGHTSGSPTIGCVRVATTCALAEGRYPFTITATVPGQTWQTQPTLDITACKEFEPGLYTQAMDDLKLVIMAGKPSYTNGLVIPLQVCCSAAPRRLRVILESATSETNVPMTEAPRFFLFYSLFRPPQGSIDAHSSKPNVEQTYQRSDGWSLEAAVRPGLYLLVFEHDSYIDVIHPRPPSEIPQSVTYRVEILPAQ